MSFNFIPNRKLFINSSASVLRFEHTTPQMEAKAALFGDVENVITNTFCFSRPQFL